MPCIDVGFYAYIRIATSPTFIEDLGIRGAALISFAFNKK